MSPQDAEIIRDVFAKVRAMGPVIDDVEAARLVEQELRANPAAALNLIRVVVGLEQERDQFAAHIDELNAYIDQIEAQPNGPATTAGHGSASGSLFGGSTRGSPWGGAPAPGHYDPPPAQPSPWGGAQPAPGPWGSQQPQMQGQPQGSGFWGSALKTGAGVAGGLLAFQAVKGLFGGGNDDHARSTERHGIFGGGADKPQDAGHRFDRSETSGDFGGGGGGDDRPRSGGFGGDDDGPAPGGIVADNIDFFGGDDREA